MAGTYYKYAERDADSQINWAEVGAEASGMLLEVNRVREEKKDALAQAQRESLNNLMNSPQGKNQDVNGVMNKFAHDLIAQKKIDYDLLTRGEMSVRDYTLKTQNQMDGTNRIFEIGKQLQATRQATLDGISDGTLSTSINVFNRGMVEQYQDMSKLGINVNSPDGSINLGIYEDKVVDGKNVRVLADNIANPNVILGKVAQTVPAFDINKANDNYTKALGSKKDYWYQAATTTGAGTITELTGVQFLQNLTRPSDIAIVKNINDSINNQVASYFTDENKLFDVLGDKLGKYDENSFTFNKDIADADENKILVMVNPSTGMTSFDKTGKNYKKQLAEASEFARTDILAKMDAERKITTTGQLNESARARAAAEAAYRAPSGEAPPPTIKGEYLNLQTPPDKNGKVSVIGVTQNIQGLVFPSGKGVELRIDQLSYNNNKGTLEVSGTKISGKEEKGRTTTGADKVVGKEGETVVKEEPFVKNDINSASLLSTAILRFRNPEDPNGGNFTSIAQAKAVLKRVYLYNKAKTEGTQARSATAKNTFQFDSQGNIIQ